MRVRRSARLLVINPFGKVLMFRFEHGNDALAGQSYWATPGGGVEEGESYAQAAVRELKEETGIIRRNAGEPVTQRSFEMMLPSGETVLAQELFFVVFSTGNEINTSRWSDNEKSVIRGHHWWGLEELQEAKEIIYPANLAQLLAASLLPGAAPM